MILETRDEGFKHSGDGHSNLPDHMLSREWIPILVLFKLDSSNRVTANRATWALANWTSLGRSH